MSILSNRNQRRTASRYEFVSYRGAARFVCAVIKITDRRTSAASRVLRPSTLSLWLGTAAYEQEINGHLRGRRFEIIVFISRCQVLKALFDEGIGRFLCQIAHC